MSTLSALTKMSVGSSFKTDTGEMWFVNVEFEDGMKGTAFAKSPSPPYAQGQMVEYEQYGQLSNGGAKLKVKVPKDAPSGSYSAPQSSGGTNAPKKSGYNAEGARVGMAINCAVQLACHGKIATASIEKWASGLIGLADRLENPIPVPAPEVVEQLSANMAPVTPVPPPPPPAQPPASEVFEDDDIPF